MSQKLSQNHTLESHLASLKRGVSIPLIRDALRGEEFCGVCGYVSPEKMEDKASHNFADENGKIFLNADRGFFGKSSVIDNSNKDAFGNPISMKVSQTMFRLKRWDHRISLDKRDMAIKKAYDRLSALKVKVNFTDLIVDESLRLYTTLYTNKMLKGKSAQLITVACAYHVCKLNNLNTNLTAMAKAANVRPKLLFAAYRDVIESMEDLNLTAPVAKQNPNENFLPPKSFLPSIAAKAAVPPLIEREALKILLDLENVKDFSEGKDRNALAGSALYIACLRNGYPCTQDEIAAAAATTSVTLRKRYKQIMVLIEKDKGLKRLE